MYHPIDSRPEEQNPSNLPIPMRVHRLSFSADTETLFYPHWHNEFEFFYLTSGTVRFVIEEKHYLIQEGDGIFLRPGQLHAAYNVNRHCCRFTAFVFYDSMLTEQAGSRFYKQYITPVLNEAIVFPVHITAAAAWQEQLLSLLTDMNAIPQDRYEQNELLLRSRLLEIWHLLCSHCASGTEHSLMHPDYKKLQPALDYMNCHYMDDITLAQLAGCIPLSEGQFCRLFKKQLHYSPITYLMRLRIRKSCQLLLDTDKKIAEIANLTGFNNISYYNKTFQKIIGCTPSVYRREQLKLSE